MTIKLPVLVILTLLSFSAAAAASSAWLGRLQRPAPGCRFRPRVCRNRSDPSTRWRFCCRNRCVDVRTDPFNCGFCGVRCLFGRQCCHGVCVNVTRNPFHCGSCQTRCPFGVRCVFGMCGYAEPLPPFPFPRPPPRLPIPPFPFPLPPLRPRLEPPQAPPSLEL